MKYIVSYMCYVHVYMYLIKRSQVIQLQLSRVIPSGKYETFWIKASNWWTIEVHHTCEGQQ